MSTTAGTASNPALAEDATTRGLPLLDKLTILAIFVVVGLVTLPRLRAFALRENERDAMRMLRVLASQPAPTAGSNGSHDLAALVAQDSSLARRLEDLELLGDGRLRRHGYLFDLTMLRPGEPMLRAWPIVHGQTGRGAFVWTPQRGLLAADNQTGRFSGTESPPEPHDIDERWVAMPQRR